MNDRTYHLAAILSADVVDYSRHMSADQNRTDEIVSACIAELSRLATSLGGQITAVAGDGIIAKFDSALYSLDCGLRFNELLGTGKYLLGGAPLQLRSGIHLGEIIVRNQSAFGDAVNVAKRVEQLADPGQILITRGIYEQVVGRSAAGFEFLGPRELKNIPRPIDIYRVHSSPEVASRAPSPRSSLHRPAALGQPVLAILPIDDLTENRDASWLCESITDEIILRVSRFHDLPVISRNTVFALNHRNKQMKEIAAELQARYVLEGSLQTAGARVRVSAQLIDVNIDRHIWADTFEGNRTDVIAVQDAISEGLVGVLVGRVEEAEEKRVQRNPALASSYERIARARQLYWQGSSDALLEAEQLCQECIAGDPHYASAWTLLSRIHNTRWLFGWSDNPKALMAEAERAARKAIALDSADARAHVELGLVLLFQRKHALALKSFERALAMNPNDADIIAEYADALHYLGRPDEAEVQMGRAMALNPYYPDWYLWNLADIHFVKENFEETIATIYQMCNPTLGCRLLAASFALLGRQEEAALAAEDVLRIDPAFTVTRWTQKQPDLDRKSFDLLFKGLRLAGLPE
jgi:TolB-like protein/class 3 adenylate cyclase/tetratricopeptide (TPR) repeat protein